MDRKIYGYAGNILRVDLSTGSFSTKATMKYAKKWLGQRGIGQWILFNELKPWVTPYEPANKVIIETGPLTGTLAPASARHSLSSKNAFTGGVGTANSGSHFGPELKFAGWDAIVIQGKARGPVYLWINNEHFQLKDASHLWGKTTWETDDLIKEELGDEDIQVICIGPAGENLVRGACVISNKNRAAGKCGIGGIFGSKNLKAIAVRGTGSVEVADPSRFMEAVDNIWGKLRKSPTMQKLSEHSTIGLIRAKNEIGSMPYKNFQDGHAPERLIDKLAPSVFKDKYKVRDMAGIACPIHCSRYYRVNHGPYAGLATEGFPLNTLVDYGIKLGIDYPPAIIKAHALCNQLGMDLDSSAGAIAWAVECYQRGILTEQDTDGLKLEWGDYGVIFDLVRKLVYREGFGNLLAEGCKRASNMLGRNSEYYAIHMKGQGLYEEVRLPLGWGLGACVATRGGGHTTSAVGFDLAIATNPDLAEVVKKVCGIKNVDYKSYEDKPKLVLYFEREQELINSFGLCMFVGTWLDPNMIGIPELAELYSAATGWETSENELIKAADRILNLEKAFNVLHANLGRKDDFPPERCLKEAIRTGSNAGFALSEERWGQMLSEYYQLHGWDPETGLQTRGCLEDLGLANVADILGRAGKLSQG